MAAPEIAYDQYGKLRLIVRAEGYCMIRRHGRTPVLIDEKEWQRLIANSPRFAPAPIGANIVALFHKQK